MTPRRPGQAAKRPVPLGLGTRRLDALVDEAIVDAYGESEQRARLLSMIQMSSATVTTARGMGVD